MCLCCCSALGRYRGRCCSPPIYRGGLLIYRWSKSASCAAATAACRSCGSASWTLLAANGRSRCGFTGFSSAALAAGRRWCAGSRRGATLGCWSCSLFLVLAALCGALRLCARGGSTLRRCRPGILSLRSLAFVLCCLNNSWLLRKLVLATTDRGCVSIKGRDKMTHMNYLFCILPIPQGIGTVIVTLQYNLILLAFATQSLGKVAMKASSPALSSSDNASSNSCSRRFFLIAFSQQESRAQR